MLALFSGLLLTVSFPPFFFFPAIAIALIPLTEASWGREWFYAGRLGFLTGLVHFSTLLWWISPTISRFGNLPGWAAWPIFGLLVCYLAIYPAIWSGLVGYWTSSKSCRLPLALALAGAWTLLEWIRGHALTGFPWDYLAYALEPVPPLIQTAEIWGPYGLTFFIVLLNVLLWQSWKSPLVGTENSDFQGNRRIRLARFGLLLICITGLWFYGKWRMEEIAHSDAKLPAVKVAAIQAAIPEDKKWDPAFQLASIRTYYRLSLKAVKGLKESGKDPALSILVIWPETATPFYFQDQSPLRKDVLSIARDLDATLLFGSPAYRLDTRGSPEYLNSAYLLGPNAVLAGRYDKRHLVPFGEYLPWGWVTAWAQDFLPSTGQFSPGSESRPLSCRDLHAGVLICFESIFPALSRETVEEGANFLAVLTNDAWFGPTGAPYQHEAMGVFRAVETRRWMIRAANTGISSLISPWGTRMARTPLFKTCYIEGTIHLRKDHTLFVRYGASWLLLFCLFWVIIPFFGKAYKGFGGINGYN